MYGAHTAILFCCVCVVSGEYGRVGVKLREGRRVIRTEVFMVARTISV